MEVSAFLIASWYLRISNCTRIRLKVVDGKERRKEMIVHVLFNPPLTPSKAHIRVSRQPKLRIDAEIDILWRSALLALLALFRREPEIGAGERENAHSERS